MLICSACETKTKPTEKIGGNLNVLTKDTLTVIMNDMVNKPFTKNLNISDLTKQGFILIELESIVNLHDSEKIDTIVSLKNGNNTFKFYKTGDKQILIYFSLVDKFKFVKQDIQIGNNKLLSSGNNLITQENQIIILKDEEEMGLIILKILDGKISSINGQYEYD